MKAFKFRLQMVLQHRESIQGERKRELLEKRRILLLIEADIEAKEKAQAENSVSASLPVMLGELQMREAFGNRLRAELTVLRKKLEEAQKELAVAQEAYVESSKEVRSLEMLRQKQQQTHHEDMEKRAQAQLDEFSVMRSGFHRREKAEES